VAFGGAAPLHVARVAESVGVNRFIVPKGAGVGSAVGFLRAPISYEVVRSLYMRLDAFEAHTINRMLSEMAAAARLVVEPAGFGRPLEESRFAYMRYVGQGHELAVPVPVRPMQEGDAASLNEAFEVEYRRQYSRIVPGMAIEMLTWALRLTIIEEEELRFETQLRPLRSVQGEARQVFDRETGTFTPFRVVSRDLLHPGSKVPGPALIVEDETTTLVTPAFHAEIDPHGNIVCSRPPTRSAQL
jgi:N-methylhydantoinase A